jgi:hypothetical protein
MTPKLKRTLALALTGGALAIGVPAALAAGGGGSDAGTGPTAAPSTLIQDQQRPDNARPDGDDCPEKGGDQGGRGGEQPGGSSGSGAESGTTTPTPSL